MERTSLSVGVYRVRQTNQSIRSLPQIEAKTPEDSAGWRLRVGERPNLRRQISILVFGFPEPFEISWRHVLVAGSGNENMAGIPPPRSDIVIQNHCAPDLGPQIKEPQQRLSDRIEYDPTDKRDRDRTKIANHNSPFLRGCRVALNSSVKRAKQPASIRRLPIPGTHSPRPAP
jgi:hypothetical protein